MSSTSTSRRIDVSQGDPSVALGPAMLRLPAEIWAIIIEDLPPSSQRSCLSVSRLHHDIAIRPLFSVIRLYSFQSEDHRTGDILDRIVIDTAFARLVKSLVVIIHNPESLAAGKLTKAIESMSDLMSFQWIGKATSFPEEVAEAIGSFCPQLRELALPVDGTVYHAPLFNLHNLRALRGSWLQFHITELSHDGPYYITDHFDIHGQLQMIDANKATLRELHLISPYLDHVPVQLGIFDSLTHLEIFLPEEADTNFLFILGRADSLESLVLAGHMWFQFYYLGETMDLLPRLSSLQLLSHFHWPSLISLGEFIRRRVSLRRLSLDLLTLWSSVGEILPIIKDLPKLRVLGLNTGVDYVDLESLALHLPPTLESLHLELCWDGHTSLRGVLESLPNLTFLHITDMGDRLPMTAQEMAHDMKHLRMVGRQGYLWDIVRIGNDETLVLWGLVDGKWLVDEDFPDEDSAWLLKYVY